MNYQTTPLYKLVTLDPQVIKNNRTYQLLEFMTLELAKLKADYDVVSPYADYPLAAEYLAQQKADIAECEQAIQVVRGAA